VPLLRAEAVPGMVSPAMDETGPWGWHNLFVLVCVLLIAVWIAKVAYQLAIIAMLRRQMDGQSALRLQRMSIYAKDFGILIRQHFNQILRMRQTVPPQSMPRYRLASHIDPTSVELHDVGGSYGASFVADTSMTCRARLYWGVSSAACEELPQRMRMKQKAHPSSGPDTRVQSAQRPQAGDTAVAARSLLELEQSLHPRTASSSSASSSIDEDADIVFSSREYYACSRSFDIAPAEARHCILARSGDLVASSELQFNLEVRNVRGEASPSIVPLVIIIISTPSVSRQDDGDDDASEAASGEATLVGFRRDDRGGNASSLKPEVWHQIAFGNNSAHCELGVYGFEDGMDDAECMICYDQPRSVVLSPCRHCSVCPSCLRSLRDERCPLCRSTFSAYILLPMRPRSRAGSLADSLA